MTVEFIGPMLVRANPYHFTVGGCVVPNLVGYKTGENEWELVLLRNGREVFSYEGFNANAVMLAVPIIAQAMALSAGWSSFGPHGTRGDNQFKCEAINIGEGENS